ncbi:Fis family transcriptional regulator [Lentzea californiensis]|uniref:Fis family transcriptional regulator n=1 Tax=Lentzea californiensis TaxID=438851 RepID=UPI0021658D4E|nr:Fis family transcriptional regulator [Lentzea californiensis]MCR3749375.1 hypothetical protein [Lentzea californiensis]
MNKHFEHAARFTDDVSAVVVERLTIDDQEVTREALRWVSGERGPLVDDPDSLAAADLTNYVAEAIGLGAHTLSVIGQAQEVQGVERLLKDVGDKTAQSTAQAAELTTQAVKDASEAVMAAARDAKTAITDADFQSRRELTTAVKTAKEEFNSELRRLFAGERPELVERLQPVLDRFGTDLDAKVSAGTADLLAKAARQFDPADPTSPMARHAAELTTRQEQLTRQLVEQHAELTSKIEEVSTVLRVREATTALAKVTPIKGESYAGSVHTVLVGIAAGLGDDYTDTGSVTGHLPRCKKGDGVLSLNDGAARVVIEMTDSTRSGWTDYLAEAERNRDAVASLGLVRSIDQNGGQTLRVIGAQRLVLAFDPDNDSSDLLRTVIMLLRTTAIATASRKGVHQVTTAEEKIAEALTHLVKVDSVKKLSASIQKSATKIDSECTALNSAVRRLLDEALVALAGAHASGPELVSTPESHGAA